MQGRDPGIGALGRAAPRREIRAAWTGLGRSCPTSGPGVCLVSPSPV